MQYLSREFSRYRTNYLKLSGGDSFGKMEISSISDSGITMKNKDSISLTRDSVIDLMGNVKFKVADSSVLRFYPFVNFESAAGDQLEIETPDTLVVGKETGIGVTARNVSISEVNVIIDGKSIGLTGDNGMLNYTPDKEGSFAISADESRLCFRKQERGCCRSGCPETSAFSVSKGRQGR